MAITLLCPMRTCPRSSRSFARWIQLEHSRSKSSSSRRHFSQIDKALQVLRKLKKPDRFLSQPEVNVFATILEVNDAARIAAYAEKLLGQISARAPRHKDELKRTLLVYFDAQHNIKRTAEALGLHINTVNGSMRCAR